MLLTDAAPEEVKSTALASSDLNSWSDWGYYHDCSPAPYRMGLKESDPQNPSAGTVFAATSYTSCSEKSDIPETVVKKDVVVFSEPASTLAAPSSGALQKPPLGPSGMKKTGGLSVPKNSG